VRDVVIFDGICNLCVQSVQFILRHEARPEIVFASLQSAPGVRLLREFNFNPDDAKTFVFISGGVAYVKSAAAIRLARQFRGAWKLLAAVWIIPRPLRDYLYDIVARNRYRWFGQFDACMLPSPALADRFLTE
jgi:predicted DCC family thiol-disulfide oxidoreductase YuxK